MSNSMFSVQDQVVLLSGGSRGIGKSLAQGFVEAGATVLITGRERATIEATAKEISTAENTVTPLVCDVAQNRDIDRAVDEAIQQFGHIDTLVNVAGVNIRKPVETYTEEEYDYIVDINLKGAFFMAQAVGIRQLQRGSGSQINIDSLNSYAPLKQVAPYALSKAGMKTMTRSLAMEWGDRGVRVNGIAPGFILTPLTEKLWSSPTMQTWAMENMPMKRLGKPEDLVGTAIFLASEAAAFLTGQTIYVDGGMVSGMQWPIERA